MKNVLSFAIGLMVIAMMVGCGGGQQPAPKAEQPAEPAFVAQTMTVPAMKVASLAKTGPYSETGKAIGELLDMVQKQKLTLAGSPPFGLFHDNPATVKPESARYEVAIAVAPDSKGMMGKTGFAVKDAPEMTVAVTDYMGPYDQVAPVYEKLYKWIADNKYQPAGPVVEWYLSDPAKTKPESLMARIGAVVAPMAPPADTTKKAEEPKKEEPKTETKAPTGR